jgi:hypothetical protein
LTLQAEIAKIRWAASATEFAKDKAAVESIERGCRLISVWNHELAFQFHGNCALPFLQELKSSIFLVPACFSVGLYKPAAASMRGAVENALYFSYFCDHEVELKTLLRDKGFYLSKKEIIDYHLRHTQDFRAKQDALGLSSELESWYSEISAIIHGQIPGVWSSRSLSKIHHDSQSLRLAVKEFTRAILIINYLFLITTADDVWNGISSQARQFLLKGMSSTRKAVLNRPLV